MATAVTQAMAATPLAPQSMDRAVLLVGDSPVLPALSRELRRRGFRVDHAARSLDAEDWLNEPSPPPVVTCVEDGDDTHKLLERVHRFRPEARMVLLGEGLDLDFDPGRTQLLPLESGPEQVLQAIEQAYAAVSREAWSDLLVCADPTMHRLLEQVARTAEVDATVLVEGESGTGKELIARAIHRLSPRQTGPFVGINCAALPENLLESELFGHEKGSFTGAISTRRGRFELAHRGTLLLDEAGEMTLALQAKLLRVLELRAVERVGGTRPIPFDTRIVATTNRDLSVEVEEGRFRLDLFYRLNVLQLRVPALRERRQDIRALADHFLPDGRRLSAAAQQQLDRHSWPGNVRELLNVLQRASILSDRTTIEAADLGLQSTSSRERAPRGTLEDVERMCILSALEECSGNRTHASRMLGISVRTLRNRLTDYRAAGLSVPEPERKTS